MKIKMHRIPEEGLRIEGDDPSSIMDFHEPLFRFEQPVHYALEATLVGSRGLSVRGRLSTIVRACCVRTLEWFDLPLAVEDFQYHATEVPGEEADLTQEIREDMLLLLPPNPVSPKAQPLDTGEPDQPRVQGEIWKKLDQLKITRQKNKD